MTEATVCLPWRSTPDRLIAHDHCVKYWHDNGFATIEADSDKYDLFLCNQARNNAVHQAKTPVVIVADADTIPHDIKQVHDAVEMAAKGFNIVWPYTIYRLISPAYIGAPASELYNAPVKEENINPPGGIVVARRETYWQIGGFDEKFVPGGWGYDDMAFQVATQTLATECRLPGLVYSFDHDAKRDQTDDNPNRDRFMLYIFAKGNPGIMKALIGLQRK